MVDMFRSRPDPDCGGLEIPGWMTPGEMYWLNFQARYMQSIVEVGCLVGRSTAALLSGCKGTVYAVDSWEGENAAAKPQFLCNVGHYPNLVTMHMTSVEAAAQIPEDIDMVFLDGDHSEESVTADINAWYPKTKIMICGHDYTHPDYPHIRQVVDKFFGNRILVVVGESIWYVRK